ncbi:hypothetical protein DNTS_018792 [Danionella cerebrum]|uniref:Uncharacterized protein n=1 Tax=Danionella cerebrum TaxID=2873325 RepID=A0A553QN63_9TELE|nr:hypothetical protein DNTS_018792 [Danionella translucida]
MPGACGFFNSAAHFLKTNSEMSQNDAVQDKELESSAETLIAVIKSSHAEKSLRGAQEKLQGFFDHHIRTKRTTTELLKDLMHTEEMVSQKLLDLEQQKSQMMQEIERMQQEVQRNLARSQNLDSEQEYPSP